MHIVSMHIIRYVLLDAVTIKIMIWGLVGFFHLKNAGEAEDECLRLKHIPERFPLLRGVDGNGHAGRDKRRQ